MLAALLAIAASPLAPGLSPAPQFETAHILDGQFAAPSLTTGDLDGDGLSDTVVWDSRTRSVSWIRSRPGAGPGPDGAGQPAPLVHLFDTGLRSFTFADVTFIAADFDGDNDIDLALTGLEDVAQETKVAIAWNDGSAGMTLQVAPGILDGSPRSIAAIDLDSDGLLEVAITMNVQSTGPDQTLVVDHQGGALDPAVPLVAGAPVGAVALRVGDVTGDGVDDLLMRRAQRSGIVYSFLRLPPGTSFPLDPATLTTVPGPTVPLQTFGAAEVADLDGDGDDDIAAQPDGFGNLTVEVWLQGPAGTFTRGPAVPTGSIFRYHQLSLADRDADGDLDLYLIADPSSGTRRTEVHPNLGGGSFGPAVTAIDPTGYSSTIFDDLTGDGRADAVALFATPRASLLFRPAISDAGLYGAEVRLGEHIGRGALAAIDANGDGRDDLVVVTQGRGARDAGIVGIKLALPGGGFSPLHPITGPGSMDRRPIAGDFNGDGRMDLVVADPASMVLEQYPGRGDGSFSVESDLSIGGTPLHLEVADLNGNGIDDLVYTIGGGSRVGYAVGIASSMLFRSTNIVGAFPQAVRPAIADFDKDGLLDIAYLVTDRVELSLQVPGTMFAPRTVAANTLAAFSTDVALAGDLDDDGSSDLLVPGRFRLPGLGDGTFGAPITVSGPFGERPSLFDYDQDGDFDLLIDDTFGLFVSEAMGPDAYGPIMELLVDGSSFVLEYTLLDLDADGDLDVMASMTSDIVAAFENSSRANIGESYCGPPVPNSSGQVGLVTAAAPGGPGGALTALDLVALDLPANAFGYFLCSRTQDDVPTVPGSVGRLCLGGAVGRFIGPGQVLDSGPAGRFDLAVDPAVIPTPDQGLIPAVAGETWNFQAWHRDLNAGGGLTSNFTSALSVTF